MKVKPALPHRLLEICKERGLSVRELSRKAHISSAHMNRIAKGDIALTLKQAMTICGVLNINSYELYGLKFDKKLIRDFDDVLLGSATVWLAEACQQFKVKLSPADYTKWVSFIYKEALAKPMNGYETHELATLVVKIIGQTQKKNG